MTTHIAARGRGPRPHHYMNADGTCHAGDLMEHGTSFVVLYSAEQLVRIVNGEKAEAWDEGHRDVCNDCCCRPDENPYHGVRLEGV